MSRKTITTLEVLIQARDLFEKKGVNHFPSISKGEVCLVTSIYKITKRKDYIGDNVYKVIRQIIDEGTTNHTVLSEWNDNHSHSQILALFDKAILKEKEKQNG